MDFKFVFILLAVDFLLGVFVGWLTGHRSAASHGDDARSGRAKTPLRVGAPSEVTIIAADPQCMTALNRAFYAVADHGKELRAFEESVETLAEHAPPAAADEANAEGGDADVMRMVSANLRLQENLAQTSNTIRDVSAASQKMLFDVMGKLSAYDGKVHALTGLLRGCNIVGSVVRLKAALLRELKDMLDANETLKNDLAAAERKLEEQSSRLKAAEEAGGIDRLMGIPNRQRFEEQLAKLHGEFTKERQSYVLALVDIDGFSQINDKHGHPTGDAVLTMIGRVLRESRRPTDHVARYAGEEFAILLSSASLVAALATTATYRKRLGGARLKVRGEEISVPLSIGIATARAGDSVDNLIQRAREAMLAAKQAGGAQTFVHDGEKIKSAEELAPAAAAPAPAASPAPIAAPTAEAPPPEAPVAT